MVEVLARAGVWTFDGEIVRIVSSQHRKVHKLRRALGELEVPLAAVESMAYEPGRKGGRLRLRLREGSDPFVQVVGGRLPDEADPYILTVEAGGTGAAEYMADEVRNALLIEQVPDGPTDRYLLPGPAVPVAAEADEGWAMFDGTLIRLEWSSVAKEAKRSAGTQQFAVYDVESVDWSPAVSTEDGLLRFRLKGATDSPPPARDPHCLTWWHMRAKDVGNTPLVAAAVVARLPHPSGATRPPSAESFAAQAAGGDDPDILLRRLRELGDLHRDGVLTDDEFIAAKQALLRRL